MFQMCMEKVVSFLAVVNMNLYVLYVLISNMHTATQGMAMPHGDANLPVGHL